MSRIFALLSALVIMAGCADQTIKGPPVPLGDFKLGHNVVVTKNTQSSVISREVSDEVLAAAMTDAIDQRFGRYDGENLYHLGISIEGYVLAPPGVPVIYTPKSLFLVTVTVWDDAGGRKLNEKPHEIIALETTGGDSLVIGSGWGRNKEKQLAGLTFNAAKSLESWLVEQMETYKWFSPEQQVMPADAAKPPRVLESNR
ncbi:MAG: hypothetical protein ABJI96_06210 [Paracoccaceae bacterium]